MVGNVDHVDPVIDRNQGVSGVPIPLIMNGISYFFRTFSISFQLSWARNSLPGTTTLRILRFARPSGAKRSNRAPSGCGARWFQFRCHQRCSPSHRCSASAAFRMTSCKVINGEWWLQQFHFWCRTELGLNAAHLALHAELTPPDGASCLLSIQVNAGSLCETMTFRSVNLGANDGSFAC